MKVFKLPDLGEGLQEAEIREWMVNEGDDINVDDILLTVETDKANVDIPSPYTGTIKKLHVAEDDIVEIGTVLVEFEDVAEKGKLVSGSETTKENVESEPEKAESNTVVGKLTEGTDELQEAASGIVVSESETRLKVLPAVRALAQGMGLNLENVTPTGKSGNITIEDVKKALNLKKTNSIEDNSSQSSEAIDAAFKQLKGSRRAMAKNMTKSHQEVVPITLFDDADTHHWPKDADFTLRIIEAVIHACRSEPSLNSHFDKHNIALKQFNIINLGIAIDTPKGLFAPTIKDIGNLTTEEIREYLNAFKLKAASQTFTLEDTKDPTIYLSNFGTIAGKYATPVISPPTVAIVGIGKSFTDLKYINGGIHPRLMLPISLSADHRAVTGGEVARFLRHLMDKLEA